MEELLELQRMELLWQGAPDSDNEDWDNPQWPDEREDCPDKEEDDSLENSSPPYWNTFPDPNLKQ